MRRRCSSGCRRAAATKPRANRPPAVSLRMSSISHPPPPLCSSRARTAARTVASLRGVVHRELGPWSLGSPCTRTRAQMAAEVDRGGEAPSMPGGAPGVAEAGVVDASARALARRKSRSGSSAAGQARSPSSITSAGAGRVRALADDSESHPRSPWWGRRWRCARAGRGEDGVSVRNRHAVDEPASRLRVARGREPRKATRSALPEGSKRHRASTRQKSAPRVAGGHRPRIEVGRRAEGGGVGAHQVIAHRRAEEAQRVAVDDRAGGACGGRRRCCPRGGLRGGAAGEAREGDGRSGGGHRARDGAGEDSSGHLLHHVGLKTWSGSGSRVGDGHHPGPRRAGRRRRRGRSDGCGPPTKQPPADGRWAVSRSSRRSLHHLGVVDRHGSEGRVGTLDRLDGYGRSLAELAGCGR